MAQQKQSSSTDDDSDKIFELLRSSIYKKESFKYFDSLKNMILSPQAPNTSIGEIEEIDIPTLELLGTVDRWSTSSDDACFFWLMCMDTVETRGGSYLHLISTIRLYRVKEGIGGPVAMYQRLFTARTDMTDALTYAPIEIYMRVVEEYYKEGGFVLERGRNSFLFNKKGEQAAMLGWIVGFDSPLDAPAIVVLHAHISVIEEIEKRYAGRMAYTDKSQIDESNPWVVVLENLKSMDKKMEDALSKNKTTIYGGVKISKGDFVGGDKFTSVHNHINIFADLLAKVDEEENLSKAAKVKLKSEITELGNAVQSTQPDEGFIKKRLQTIKKMAPDIFEVTLSTLLNPVSGLGTVVTKIAEKMKEGKAK